MAIFPTFFFLSNIGEEHVYYDILEKNAFLGYKKKSSKSRKIDIFPTFGFGPKMAIFSTFFLDTLGQENVFYDILERKNAVLGYKKKKFKRSKIDIFPNGLTHCFGPKMAIFPTFSFLRQARKRS